jgi:hypothetical protein
MPQAADSNGPTLPDVQTKIRFGLEQGDIRPCSRSTAVWSGVRVSGNAIAKDSAALNWYSAAQPMSNKSDNLLVIHSRIRQGRESARLPCQHGTAAVAAFCVGRQGAVAVRAALPAIGELLGQGKRHAFNRHALNSVGHLQEFADFS